MSILLLLLATAPALFEPEYAYAFFDKSFVKIEWRRQPTLDQVAAMLPPAKGGVGFAHLQCNSVTRAGRLRGCLIVKPAVGSSDPDYDAVARRLLRSYRVNESMAAKLRPHADRIMLDFQFFNRQGNPQLRRIYGDCSPFCSPTPPPPPPPPPPQEN